MTASTRSVQSTQPFTPPVSQPKENDSRSTCIITIAIPIIVALASFLVLSANAAIAITAVVTIGAIAYAMSTKNKPSQPSSTTEPCSAAATPSFPKEIIFMSAKRNETADINKAEYMSVAFETKEIAEQFITDHQQKFREFGYPGKTRVLIYPGKRPMKESVDALKAIYGQENGSLSQVCQISFARYEN